MTNKTIEEIAREIMGAFIMRRDPMELEAKIIEALREQAAQTTLPSWEEVLKQHEKNGGDQQHLAGAAWIYGWLRDNVKAKERHEVSDGEIISMASDECFEIYHDHSSTFSVGYLKGYRAALEKIK